jgi:hypothetical protein
MSVTIRASSLAVTMLSGLVALSTAAKAADAVESDQVSRALSDVKLQAFQLKADADEMETFTRSAVTWEAHVEAINKIKDDVNKMGRLLANLQSSRTNAAAWQRTAIDRISPVAKELTSNTSAAIEHLNKNPRNLNTAAYQTYLEAIADSASNLAATITDFVDYGKTKQRLDRLTAKLELPAGA